MSLKKLPEQTSDAAAEKIVQIEEQTSQRNAEVEIQLDIEAAKRLIRDLPPLLKRAAEVGSKSMKVLRMKKDFHFKGYDVTAAKREFDLHGMSEANTFAGALAVVKWLDSEGLRVSLVNQPFSDEGQGHRSWNELEIYAVWD